MTRLIFFINIIRLGSHLKFYDLNNIIIMILDNTQNRLITISAKILLYITEDSFTFYVKNPGDTYFFLNCLMQNRVLS